MSGQAAGRQQVSVSNWAVGTRPYTPSPQASRIQQKAPGNRAGVGGPTVQAPTVPLASPPTLATKEVKGPGGQGGGRQKSKT